MALLTPITEAEAKRLLAEYGLPLEQIEALSLGSVNSNFRLRMQNGSLFFARIYEEQGREGAAMEVALLAGLAQMGLPVAEAVRQSNGECIASFKGKPFAVFPWIEGTITCQSLVSSARAFKIGEALARLHVATASLPSLNPSRFGVPEIFARLDTVLAAGGGAFDEVVEDIRAKLRHYAELRDGSLPKGVIHGDLFRDNVLWRGDELAALLDFESASYGVFMYDLLVTVLAWCYGSKLDVELARVMVRGYESVRPISAEERQGALAEGAIACLRFATTRITDFSLRAKPGEAPVRDFRRFLARLRALEGGALAEFMG
ncbi:MAG: homoserine kinase [Polyangiaceae bacterium]|nr:homoserine kinase [Polyangiaceae bacterium]